MRTLTIALLAGSAVLAPASAQAVVRSAYQREYLAHYNQLRARHGADAPGCNLLTNRYRNRCHGKATAAKVKRSNVTLERMLYVPPPPPPAPAVKAALAQPAPNVAASSAPANTTAPPVAASAAPSGGGGCGDLPAYIVQRESGGDPNASNGPYHGCGQVDMGLHYGRGAHNWPTAANPPG
jgi:hypothetical protein